MRFENSFHVRPATANDRQNLANLIHFENHVQRHLEWRSALDWLGCFPFQILEKNGKLVAAMACPPDPPQIGWIRLFAASSNVTLEKAWKTLWPSIEYETKNSNIADRIVSIPLYYWFRNLLEYSKFDLVEHVIVLARSGGTNMPPASSSLELRHMISDDLQTIEAVDRVAFTPLWQISRFTMEGALNQAAVATVALAGNQIVGYLIGTAAKRGGHLARVAVHPQFQGQGIGYTLVRDALLKFSERGAQTITVNTQKGNLASMAIYQKAGFIYTGEDYPVFQYMIK